MKFTKKDMLSSSIFRRLTLLHSITSRTGLTRPLLQYSRSVGSVSPSSNHLNLPTLSAYPVPVPVGINSQMTSKATDTAKPRTIPRSLIPHGWIQDPTELAIASKIFPHDEYDIPGNGPPQALFRRHADPPLFIVEVKSFEGQSNGRFYLWHPQVKKVDEVLEPSTLEEIVSLLGKKSEHSHKLNTRAVETRSAAERRSLLHAQTAKMKQVLISPTSDLIKPIIPEADRT